MPRQLTLPLKPRFKHGGARPGAGRPKNEEGQSHVPRPRLTGKHPVHVTLGIAEHVPHLRRKEMFRCLKDAVRQSRKLGFRVAHFAILANHIHLIIEPPDSKGWLGRVMQSFGISFAKRVNSRLGRKGAVFAERYHAHILTTPTETRRALAYVLTNESRHQGRGKFGVTIDPFSSAYSFNEWAELLGRRPDFHWTNWSEDVIANWLDEILIPARTWLLRSGWTRGKA